MVVAVEATPKLGTLARLNGSEEAWEIRPDGSTHAQLLADLDAVVRAAVAGRTMRLSSPLPGGRQVTVYVRSTGDSDEVSNGSRVIPLNDVIAEGVCSRVKSIIQSKYIASNTNVQISAAGPEHHFA